MLSLSIYCSCQAVTYSFTFSISGNQNPYYDVSYGAGEVCTNILVETCASGGDMITITGRAPKTDMEFYSVSFYGGSSMEYLSGYNLFTADTFLVQFLVHNGTSYTEYKGNGNIPYGGGTKTFSFAEYVLSYTFPPFEL